MSVALRSVGVRFAHTARSIAFATYGPSNEVLQLVQHMLPNPAEGQVLLKLVAAPINPADRNQIEGVYPSKPTFRKDLGTADPIAIGGNEGVFEVVESRDPKLQIGEWVVPRIASFGTWTSHRVAESSDLLSLGKPNGLTPVQAATISVNPGTAYRMLSDFASLEPNDWFIQNGGNSGVGRMAIQLGRLWGYKSISVVRDRRDIDQLKQELHDLGSDHVVTEEQIADKSIKTIIADWTCGKPPKLALNCVGGRSAANVARQVAPGGQLVTYGGMSKQPVSLPTSLYIFKNVVARGFWLTNWNRENPRARQRMLLELADMFRSQELRETAMSAHHIDLLEGSGEDFFATFKSAFAKSGKQVLVAN